MKKIAGSGIWESFAESACKLFICWVAIRKPKTSRRKRKPKPRITGIKGCKPAEPHAVQADERISSSKLWRHQVDYRAQKTKKQCWTSTFLKWKATRPLRARELHSVKPMTKCKVHLALRAPMPWKAWSFQQIFSQLIHFIDSQQALVFRSLMMSHGFLWNSNHAVLRELWTRLGFSLLFGDVCRPSIAVVLSSTWHLNGIGTVRDSITQRPELFSSLRGPNSPALRARQKRRRGMPEGSKATKSSQNDA